MADRISQAWANIVLAEAAVSYAYSRAGVALAPAAREQAVQWYDEHGRARDQALLTLAEAGADPVALPAFFDLPGPVENQAQARALLALVEARLALSYAELVAVLPLADRQIGIDAALLANERARHWGAENGPWGATTPDLLG